MGSVMSDTLEFESEYSDSEGGSQILSLSQSRSEATKGMSMFRGPTKTQFI